ncbi:MAG: response regulator transcription factor [Lachnospiraceae bacterium]|nr:response regulator transcription factor [Lachnospiraceae bacterium]
MERELKGKSRILLIEDDYALAMGTEYALKAEGYEVAHTESVKDTLSLVKTQKFDLALLDVMLPDGNGYDLCKMLKEQYPSLPIIFLTAVGEEVNVVMGLELGADDYVCKPYRSRELLSRIRAVLRRCGKDDTNEQEKCIVFGNHRLYPEKFRLYNGDNIVELTPAEIRLLVELARNRGQVLTRGRLLERVYDVEEKYIDDNTLSVYMKRLRDKLGDDAYFLETVRGVGYCMN